ncbi:unnamed protein product [Microthlaspi erraticum]|uniref:Uncharacterized protein n=1 Tax=Microthlaspi erraticum TaxID=1685480 RepID=A0A6D2IG43_9BRAS|nr:unnamed protein product [Microthlaspi erraticum]
MLVVSFWYQSLDGFRTVRIARLSIIPFSYKRFRARGCGARGRGAEAVVAELEAVEAGAEIVDFGGFGRECVIGSFSASGSTGAPGVPPVAEVQQRAAGFVQPQAVGLMVPSYLDMMGHMQRIGTPYFEGGVSPEAADEWRQRLERNFQSIRFLV